MWSLRFSRGPLPVLAAWLAKPMNASIANLAASSTPSVSFRQLNKILVLQRYCQLQWHQLTCWNGDALNGGVRDAGNCVVHCSQEWQMRVSKKYFELTFHCALRSGACSRRACSGGQRAQSPAGRSAPARTALKIDCLFLETYPHMRGLDRTGENAIRLLSLVGWQRYILCVSLHQYEGQLRILHQVYNCCSRDTAMQCTVAVRESVQLVLAPTSPYFWKLSNLLTSKAA